MKLHKYVLVCFLSHVYQFLKHFVCLFIQKKYVYLTHGLKVWFHLMPPFPPFHILFPSPCRLP